ncbi:MAG: chemotaxis protein CheW [Clostridiaceae bacterium]
MDSREPMLDMFIFETTEMLEQLQTIVLESEKNNKFDNTDIDEIFRIMHTIKGSAGMMLFDNIAKVSHTIEDLFYCIRESKPKNIDFLKLTNIVLEGSDYIKGEIDKINNGMEMDTDFSIFTKTVEGFLDVLKNENIVICNEDDKKYKIDNEIKQNNNEEISRNNFYSSVLYFDDDCEMENIRCFSVVHDMESISNIVNYEPDDIMDNNSSELIRTNGFKINYKTDLTVEEIEKFFMKTMFLRDVKTEIISTDELNVVLEKENEDINIDLKDETTKKEKGVIQINHKQSLISVDVDKLDKLMDLVGELVISEAMVSKNSELEGLKLDNFNKAARQHRKRLTDLQDIVMSIRMVSLAPTLNKMNRLVRDMSKKLNKETELTIVGQDTEVDKNIIEHIGDPLMHIVRNSMDHGIESFEERKACGKETKSKISIEAKNTGGEVWIVIKDDGKGLDKKKILKKAINHGLIKSNEKQMTDKEIYSMIFVPGFSTNENVTEFSGRGVGMDVVVKEIEKVRGTVFADSVEGIGTTISIRIPLTLAIIDGMTIKVGNSRYTIPITSIKKAIIIKNKDIINDLDGNEMILERGECYSILRLHEFYKVKTNITNIEDGIILMIEDENKVKCIFADELIGEQQVVIKSLPKYIKKVKGVSGCTLLGDGGISLILDASEIVNI